MYHIYRFLDAENNILYIGYSSKIQVRMKEQHFSGHSHLSQKQINNVAKVEHIGFESEEEALLHEKYYIDLYKPPYNATFYTDYDINNLKLRNNWSFYCDTSNGKICRICNLGNTSNDTRANLIINKELKKQLEKLSKEQNRSFNNLIVTILQNHLKEKE